MSRFDDWKARRRWNRRWSSPEYRPGWLEDGPRRQVRAAYESGWITPGTRVLDIGCGEGNTAAWLATVGCEVVGVDVSSAVQRARELHRDVAHLTLVAADVGHGLPFEGPFDVVIDLGCLHILSERARVGYADNIRALTSSGSKLLYLLRVGRERREMTADECVDLVRNSLGPQFDLTSVEPTEMAADRDASSRPGVEIRLVRG